MIVYYMTPHQKTSNLSTIGFCSSSVLEHTDTIVLTMGMCAYIAATYSHQQQQLLVDETLPAIRRPLHFRCVVYRYYLLIHYKYVCMQTYTVSVMLDLIPSVIFEQ
jgi:hypothetical protein